MWSRIQGSLFPRLEEHLGPLTEQQKSLVATLEVVRVEEYVPRWVPWGPGRSPHDRKAIARAFVAKAVYNLTTTRALIEQLKSNPNLRRICGWENRSDLPSESVFSRAFAEFAESRLPERVHQALIEKLEKDKLVGHISRDSTEINAREKPAPKPKTTDADKPKRKPGRPKKGEAPPPPEPTRLERQATMNLEEMLKDLPRWCDIGAKRDSKGRLHCWTGYKLHIDSADGQIPISCVLTSASLHDSQVAIPLAEITAGRVTNLYDLMDSAYDAKPIREKSRSLGHVPIIDPNPRSGEVIEMDPAQAIRYNERSTSERVNSRLKDEFGGRMVRVRGPMKVMAHLMFGVLALTADQLLRLVT